MRVMALISQLQQIEPGLDIYGIGGPKMLRQGLRALYTMDSLQVHGNKATSVVWGCNNRPSHHIVSCSRTT